MIPLGRLIFSAMTVLAASVAATSLMPVDAHADQVDTLIKKAKKNTAVGFTGGYGNIIGFHKFNAKKYSIFYSDDVKAVDKKHSHALIRDGKKIWTFAFDKSGRLTSAEDGEGNSILLTQKKGGAFDFAINTLDGYKKATKTGKVSARAVKAKAVSSAATSDSVSAKRRKKDPTVKVPVRVNACTSWPNQAASVSLTYNFGQGEQTKVVEVSKRSGQSAIYNHVIRPYSGIRSKPDAVALATAGFPSAKNNSCFVSAQLTAACKKVSGDVKAICESAEKAISAHCEPKKLATKTTGKNRAQIKKKLKKIVKVTAEVAYRNPEGKNVKIQQTGSYRWNKAGAAIVVDLPCWDIYQADFRRKSTFSAHGGECRAPIELGDQLAVVLGRDGAPGEIVVLKNNFTLFEKNCFVGTYNQTYTLGLGAVVDETTVTANHENPKPYGEIYDFNFVRAPTQLTGTYTFTLDHKFDHTGVYAIPLTLPLVTNAN